MKRGKSLLTLMALLTLVASQIWSIQPVLAQGHKWVGYTLYNRQDDSKPSKPGTYGEIYTINPNLPDGPHFSAFYEWVSSQLSVRYGYWVQVGYGKGTKFWLNSSGSKISGYYVERMGENDDPLSPEHWFNFNGPATGTWHSYATRHPWELPWEPGPKTITEWRFYIDGSRVWTTNVGQNYYRAVDEGSKAETASDVGDPGRICLTGTHFWELKFYDPLYYYFYWEIHYPVRDPPYSLTEVTHHEFYASGGG